MSGLGPGGGLLEWFEDAGRDLPWRRTRDPWAVLVSEVMLQQTQVARVLPRYEAFVARFPTVAECAAASRGEVIEHWEGLGYNRRAVHLHDTAEVVVDRHGGRIPSTLDELLRLPGLGPYTARAVLVFAYEQDHGVLDTNVARIVSRFAGRRLTRSEAQTAADASVPVGRAWDWNQAMLDLGATICTKRAPSCGGCPLVSACAWHAAGHPAPDPAQGTGGTSRPQGRFEGSDRQGRGRLVAALRDGPVPLARLAEAAGWPRRPDRARAVAEDLVRDGVAVLRGGELRLPGR